MNLLPDDLLVNEYAFTFFITFLSVSIKGIANKTEGIKSVLKGESYDFGPELVFISISFAVSKITQLYETDASSPYIGLLKTVVFHLFILVFLIVILRRLSYNSEGKVDLIKGMLVPLVMGFAALYLVLTYTLSI